MQVGVAHPGTQHSWQTALAFQESAVLRWYATSYYYKKDDWPDRYVAALPAKLRDRAERELRRRRNDDLDDRLVRRALESEFIERPVGRYFSRQLMLRLQRGRHQRFPGRLLRIAIKEPVDLIWGPHDCLEAFHELKRRGVKCVLDQPIGHFAELDRTMRQEYDANPDFFFDRNVGIGARAIDRQCEATEIADAIVTGSPFASQTVLANGVAPSKIHTISYGYDERRFPAAPEIRTYKGDRPLEFLFVGAIGARKGLAYLLEAFAKLDKRLARLTLVGPLDMPAETFARYSEKMNYVGQVTRPEVMDHMSKADCFIFPSLFEGSALVLYEAVAMGLPIIQTSSSGTGVTDDLNGQMIEAGSVEAILAAITRVLDRPSLVEQWSTAALALRPDRTWSNYRANIRDLAQVLVRGGRHAD